MHRSSLAVAVVAGTLVAVGLPASASAALSYPAGHHHPAPSPVTSLRTYDSSPGTTVSWTNPSKHFDHAVLRYARGGTAPRFASGHARHLRAAASSARLTGLTPDTAYSVSVWAVDAHGERSAPRHAHFTNEGGTAGRGRYTARYVDRAGHPLAGVEFFAFDVDTDREFTATSGHKGLVSLTLPAGQYFLGADGDDAIGGGSDATGYVSRETIGTIHAGHVLAAGTLTLGAGGLVRVHVVNAAGKPVEGLAPSLVPVVPYVDKSLGFDDNFFDAFYPLAAVHRTDADGNVTERAVEGSYPFRVCVNSYSGPADATRGYLAACTSTSDLARAGRTVSTAPLTLQRQAGGTIRGVVRGRDRAGFAGTSVEVLAGRRPVAYLGTTNQGAFEADGLLPGTYRVCAVGGTFTAAGRTGYRPGCAAEPVTVPPSLAARSSEIVLRRAAAATGTVTGPHGVPVPGVYVAFGRGDPDGELGVETDGEGHWLEKGLPAGKDSVCLFTDYELPSAALPSGVRGNCNHKHRHVRLQAGRVRSGLDAHLRVGGAIEGQVVDRSGRPVPYAIIETVDDDQETTGGGHGQFRLTGLDPGQYRICAGVGDEPNTDDAPTGCLRHAVVATSGRIAHVRVVVPMTSGLLVTTVDQHGRPVAGVDATAVRACSPDDCDEAGTPLLARHYSDVAAAATTDAHGQVLLDDLRPGHYAVCLFAYYARTRAGAPATGYRDRCSATTFDIDVRAGHTGSARLVLRPAGAVAGRVTDAAGHPLQGVLVHVQGSAADDLPAEDTEYNPFGDPYGSDDGGAAVTPGYYSRTAADGTFSVRSVQPGHQLVCADPSAATGGTSQGGYLKQCVGGAVGSTKKGTPVTVRAGTTTSGVDLALTAGVAVSGTVTTAVVGAHPYTYLVLLRGDDEVAQIERHGRRFDYQFPRLVPGAYKVCVVSFAGPSGRSSSGECYRDVPWTAPDQSPPPTSTATPVTLTAGDRTSDIDVAVPK